MADDDFEVARLRRIIALKDAALDMRDGRIKMLENMIEHLKRMEETWRKAYFTNLRAMTGSCCLATADWRTAEQAQLERD